MSKRRKKHRPAAQAQAQAQADASPAFKQTGKPKSDEAAEKPQEAAEPVGPEESAPEESGDVEAPEAEAEAEADHGYDPPPPPPSPVIQVPLVSSHVAMGKVRTAGVCISPESCRVICCSSGIGRDRRFPADFGAEQIAQHHPNIIVSKAQRANQAKFAEQLVKRARHGDQNAMAIIALARDNAKGGHPHAISAVNLIAGFIKRNPVRPGGMFGAESDPIPLVETDAHGSTMLANGPPLTNPRIRIVLTAFGAERDKQQLLVHGMKTWNAMNDKQLASLVGRLSALQVEVMNLGRTLGRARALQLMRSGKAPISSWNKRAGWELGE